MARRTGRAGATLRESREIASADSECSVLWTQASESTSLTSNEVEGIFDTLPRAGFPEEGLGGIFHHTSDIALQGVAKDLGKEIIG